MYGLPVALLGIALIAYANRREPIVATAGVLLANWGLNTLVATCFEAPYPWWFFMIMDYLSGLAMIMLYVSKWQAAIAAVYVAQIVAHGGFGVSEQDDWAKYSYWWTLFYLGWSQALICGGWLGREAIRLDMRHDPRMVPSRDPCPQDGSR